MCQQSARLQDNVTFIIWKISNLRITCYLLLNAAGRKMNRNAKELYKDFTKNNKHCNSRTASLRWSYSFVERQSSMQSKAGRFQDQSCSITRLHKELNHSRPLYQAEIALRIQSQIKTSANIVRHRTITLYNVNYFSDNNGLFLYFQLKHRHKMTLPWDSVVLAKR